jgi:hypothetical protein
MDTKRRNLMILKLVMRGYTCSQVGSIYGITGVRVQQLARRVGNEVLNPLRKAGCADIDRNLGLIGLRKYKNYIISVI